MHRQGKYKPRVNETSEQERLLERAAVTSRGTVLKKDINLFTGVAYVAGGIIGSGIFITPSSVLRLTHSFGLSMVIWTLGGVMAILGGLCYIELALLVRKSGAEYNYLKEAYSFRKKHWTLELLGSLLAFMYFWTSALLIRSSSLAVICLTSAHYMVRPFYLNNEELPNKTVVLLAITILSKWYIVTVYGAWIQYFNLFSFMTIYRFMILIVIYYSLIPRKLHFKLKGRVVLVKLQRF